MAGDAGAAGGAGGAGGRAGSGAGAGAGPGGAPAGAGGAGAPARWNYCVTANRPTRATHSCCGAFTAPGARNLLVAKSSFVEIFLLTPRGLKALHDVPIYGRIAVMELFRPKVRDCCLPPQPPPPPPPPPPPRPNPPSRACSPPWLPACPASLFSGTFPPRAALAVRGAA